MASGEKRDAVTDQAGRFTFTDVPAGMWTLYLENAPDGWILPYGGSVKVDGGPASADLRYGAQRPLSEVLKASIKLEKDTYAVGDEAKIKVTLTNRGRKTLTGIKAGCNRSGEGPHVRGTDDPARWGDLVWSRPGVTLLPGETKVLHVTGVVPDYAPRFSSTGVGCDFGNDERFIHGYPADSDAATVPPQANGPVRGQLFHDRDNDYTVDDGELVAGVRVKLVDRANGRVVASTVTDQEGRVSLTDIPGGAYELRIVSRDWQHDGKYGGYGYYGGCEMCWTDWVRRIVPTS